MEKNEFNTPILFIIFNRPDTTERVFEVIKKIKPKRLYIAADGPRSDRQGEAELCIKTRHIATAIDWPCEVKTRFLDKNIGCRNAVPEAISWFFSHEEKGIILEDDCLADPSFFYFCENLLDKYCNDQEIMMISGDNFQANEFKLKDDSSYYFSKYANIWGWASWRRAWKNFSNNFKELDDKIMKQQIKKSFSEWKERRYWYGFYKKLKNGRRLGSWDANWSLSLIYHGGISLVPNINMIQNIGFGSGATHSTGDYQMSILNGSIKKIIHPKNRLVNKEADNFLFKKIYSKSIFLRLLLKFKDYFN